MNVTSLLCVAHFYADNYLFASVHVMDIATEFSDAEAPPSSDQTNRLHFYPKTDVVSRETVRETFK